MNRRSLILLLIGVIASLAGMLAATRIRTGRCAALGGRWSDVERACQVAAGAPGESAGQITSAYLLGLVIAVVVGFMLWRMFLFVTGRGPDRSTG